MRTAGRAVLTAGSTVVIGMLGLLVLRQSLLPALPGTQETAGHAGGSVRQKKRYRRRSDGPRWCSGTPWGWRR